MEQDIEDNKLQIGDEAPNFNLPSIEGQNYNLNDFQKDILVVVFTCNHCPYAQSYQQRLYKLQEEFDEVNFVGINSNDAEAYPEDSFEEMKKRTEEFNFPYLRDEDQEVAKKYGAQLTPEVFVFDENRELRYHGRIDDNWKSEQEVENEDLRNALLSLLKGEEIENPETPAVGCSIKWHG